MALKRAKEQGDFLIVGLYDDDVINHHKGNNYPILSL
jgi:ethanolamine-phosphate cytidylyltransferase